MMQLDTVRIYQQINRILVEEKGFAGMFLVFDEFSKYLEGHGAEYFSNDMKALQDMCELVNASKGQMIFTLVAHKAFMITEKPSINRSRILSVVWRQNQGN